jgi:hypothetical protein
MPSLANRIRFLSIYFYDGREGRRRNHMLSIAPGQSAHICVQYVVCIFGNQICAVVEIIEGREGSRGGYGSGRRGFVLNTVDQRVGELHDGKENGLVEWKKCVE